MCVQVWLCLLVTRLTLSTSSRLHVFYARSVCAISVKNVLPTNNHYAFFRQLSQFHSRLTMSHHAGTIYWTQHLIICSRVINVWLGNLKREELICCWSFLILLTLQSLLDCGLFLETLNRTYFLFFCDSAPRPTPTWRTRVFFYVWVITFVLSSIEGSTSRYVTASTAIRIVWRRHPTIKSKQGYFVWVVGV
jgi:hypothetical protein